MKKKIVYLKLVAWAILKVFVISWIVLKAILIVMDTGGFAVSTDEAIALTSLAWLKRA